MKACTQGSEDQEEEEFDSDDEEYKEDTWEEKEGEEDNTEVARLLHAVELWGGWPQRGTITSFTPGASFNSFCG